MSRFPQLAMIAGVGGMYIGRPQIPGRSAVFARSLLPLLRTCAIAQIAGAAHALILRALQSETAPSLSIRDCITPTAQRG